MSPARRLQDADWPGATTMRGALDVASEGRLLGRLRDPVFLDARGPACYLESWETEIALLTVR
jgi:hypothetical protein